MAKHLRRLLTAAGLSLALVVYGALGDLAAAGPAPAPKGGPMRVLLLGDSLIATELGVELQQMLDATPGVRCHRRARSATGLSRQDHFDWPRAARLAVARRQPELVVVMIGSNDGQDVVPPRRRPILFPRVNWERPDWPKAYRGRVDALLDAVVAPRREVLWLELPIMRSRSLDRKLRRVRAVQRAAALARPARVDFVSMVTVMKSAGTPLLTWRQRWRKLQADGVHFSRRGSRILSRLILPVFHAMALRVYLNRLEQPRPGPPAKMR